jgi:crossover junction endodeoxyribonuclease RuvC
MSSSNQNRTTERIDCVVGQSGSSACKRGINPGFKTDTATQVSSPRIIIGVDPGTLVTGYAIVCISTEGLKPLDFGCIRPPKQYLLSHRYHVIFQDLSHLIQTHNATEMAIETPFVQRNVQSALKLGSALGCAIIAAKEHGLHVYGYSPRQVKQGVAGLGGATKADVEAVVRSYLNLRSARLSPDASDALSIAMFHANQPPTYKAKEL